jgi:glycosyltransferase involved in cell wall biosynthesis
MKTGAIGNGRARLRVVHLTLGLDMGGQEQLLLEFARHADRAHFALHFVSLSTRGALADDLEALGWPVTALAVPPGLRPGLVLRLAGLFRRWQTDVVHTHDDRPLIYGAPAARLAAVSRVLHTRHGQAFWIKRRQTALVRVAAALADLFVCVSEDSARLTVRHGVAARRVVTIRNGIDLARFAYAGPAAGGPAVTVARLSPEKGIDHLVRAAALVVRQDPSFRLLVAGGGACLAALQELAGALGVGEQVRFLGQVRDIPGLLASAGLFVLPSLSEGVSLTLLEAMARGLPVVTTRVGGNPEVVAEGETGLLVPAQDPATLAAAILELRRDPERGRRMGLAGRERVERHFDVRRMVVAYEALYREGNGRRGAGFKTSLVAIS